jgi:hypothetical protein
VPPCRPGISTDAQDAVVDVGHAPRRRVACVKAMPCQLLGEPGHGAAHPEMAAVEGRQRGGKLQIISLSRKPICKPDAARQRETGETEPTERDGICPVRRGHRTRERRLETVETHVVWLITQRSRVQIPPPLLFSAGQGPFSAGRGPFAFGRCSKTCSSNSLPRGPAARQGRRDETACTWWTSPPAIAGCLAQRYHSRPPVSSCPRWTSQNPWPWRG